MKRSNRLRSFAFELPANVYAEFVMDFSKNVVVSLNGETQNTGFGSIRLGPGLNEMEGCRVS